MTPVEELFQLLWDTPKDKLTWFAIKNQMLQKEKLHMSEAYYNAFFNATKGIEQEFEDYKKEKEEIKESNKNSYVAGYLDNGYYEGAEEDAAKLWNETYGFNYNESFNTEEK